MRKLTRVAAGAAVRRPAWRAAVKPGCLAALVALVGLGVASSASAATIDYYRFENDLSDSGTGAHTASVLAGSSVFNADVPVATIPQTGQSDTKSLALTTGDALVFDYAFPFDTLTNATLEFYVKPSALASEQDLFWTTTGAGDTNRFNLGITSNGSVFFDYRESNATLHSLGTSASGGIVASQWNFVAIAKSGNMYYIYVNNLAPVVTTDSSPSLPTSAGWTINGRATEQPSGGNQFSGLIDEVRLSDQALLPPSFLESAPCANSPVTQWTAGSGGNDHYYQVVCAPAGGISWTAASAAATVAGGHLATLTSSAENGFAAALADQAAYWYPNQFNANIGPWIGLSRPLPCDSAPFTWVTGEPFSFTNWSSGEPNCSGGAEHLVHLFNGTAPARGGAWNDVGDSAPVGSYLVEFDACVAHPSGLVSWWIADDTPNDIIGGHHGTLTGGATYAAGQVRSAFSFPTAGSVDIPYSTVATPAAITIDAWVNPASTVPTASIFNWRPVSNDTGVTLEQRFAGDGTVLWNVFATGGVASVTSGSTVLPTSTWTHVAGTYDGTTAKLYFNGELVGSGALSGALTAIAADAKIGRNIVTAGAFNGLLDEVEVFDRPLTQQEIRTIYSAGSFGKCIRKLDVDLNGTVSPLTDGLLILRRLFGFSDSALISGAVGGGCMRCDATAIATYIDAIFAVLDVDGNGTRGPLTDGLLILRRLFGFTGSTLINGVVGGGCTRCDADSIAAYVNGLAN